MPLYHTSNIRQYEKTVSGGYDRFSKDTSHIRQYVKTVLGGYHRLLKNTSHIRQYVKAVHSYFWN